MKRLMLVGASLAIASSVMASDPYVETISSAGASQVNTETLEPGMEYVLQCTVDTRYRTCVSSSCTSTTDDLMFPAGSGIIIVMPSLHEAGVNHTRLAIIPTTAVADTCRLYKSVPRLSPVVR